MSTIHTSAAHALLDINRDFEARAAAEGEKPSIVLLANLLQAIPDGGINVVDLPKAARVSRRAIKSCERLTRIGWIKITPLSPKGKFWELTDTGREVRDRWAEAVTAAESDWSVKVGEDNSLRLRKALEDFVLRLELELAHYPIAYGPADGRTAGGNWVAAKPGPPRIPSHGADWIPV